MRPSRRYRRSNPDTTPPRHCPPRPNTEHDTNHSQTYKSFNPPDRRKILSEERPEFDPPVLRLLAPSWMSPGTLTPAHRHGRTIHDVTQISYEKPFSNHASGIWFKNRLWQLARVADPRSEQINDVNFASSVSSGHSPLHPPTRLQSPRFSTSIATKVFLDQRLREFVSISR